MKDVEYLKKYYKGNIDDAIKKLNSGIPVQYIVGNVSFYGFDFIVNNNVLIPRFETEELVEKTINYINKLNKKVKILDIGTGSGCIAVTLKKLVDSDVDAVDISDLALNVARENAIKNNVDVNFFISDMLDNVDKKYDVIISNPPYISYDEEIMDIVKNNEPKIALFAKDNGLYFYKKILDKARLHLNDKFVLAFEIGYMQGDALKEYAYKNYSDCNIFVERDLQNRDRFLFIIKT